MIRRPPRSTRTDTLFPYTTLFRSASSCLSRRAVVALPKSLSTYPTCSTPHWISYSGSPEARLYGSVPGNSRYPTLGRRSAVGTKMVNHNATIGRSEEHTSELQSLMRISYADFCLKKKTQKKTQ